MFIQLERLNNGKMKHIHVQAYFRQREYVLLLLQWLFTLQTLLAIWNQLTDYIRRLSHVKIAVFNSVV